MKTCILVGLFRPQKGFKDIFTLNSKNRFFDSKIAFLRRFTCKMLQKCKFWVEKSIFRAQRKSIVKTFLWAKQTHQDACFHILLSGIKVHTFWKNQNFPFFGGPKCYCPPSNLLNTAISPISPRDMGIQH